MLQDSIITEQRHQQFIKTICASGIVYGLKNRKGFVTSSSVHYEDDDGQPIGILCFWAEKARAKSCVKDSWKRYKVTKITLVDFMENWCIGMDNDDLLVGTAFDQNMFGFEAEPLELLLDLANELIAIDKDFAFKKFDGIRDLKSQVEAILK